MADGQGGGTDWVAWAVAVLATIGGAVGTAWNWLKQERKASRDANARPYKTLFESLEKKLEKVQEGFALSQGEHAECKATVARLEERSLFQEREISELRSEVTTLRAELAEGRRRHGEAEP